MGKADQETELKSGTPASNPSSAKPHGCQSRDRTAPPCSRSGCRCLLTALPSAWTQLQTPHSCPSTSPFTGRAAARSPRRAHWKGSIPDIGNPYISELQLIFNTHSWYSTQTWNPSEPDTSLQHHALSGSKHSICNISPGKTRRSAVFRQMSEQLLFPRDSLPDCPAGFVILRAQHNSIRINFVIR